MFIHAVGRLTKRRPVIACNASLRSLLLQGAVTYYLPFYKKGGPVLHRPSPPVWHSQDVVGLQVRIHY